MPDATITSTASTFGTISGTFAADQSTIVGTVTGIVAGTLDGSVGVPGPAGSQGPAGAQGPQGVPGVPGAPGQGVPAGGTAGQFLQKTTTGVDYATDWVTVNLTGLATESWVTAGFYPLTGNPSGFLTASALTPYLTSATAASTYQTLAGMSAYLTTSAAAAGYYPLTGNPSGFLTSASLSGYATESWVTGQGYITSAALTPYLTSATAAATYQTLAGMSDYAPLASPAFTGTPTAPTPSPGTDSTRIATTEWVKDLDYAPLNSPQFNGNPRGPTPSLSDNDTSLATTAFVKGQSYLTSAALVGYATESYVTSALTGYATESWVAGLGYITSVDANAAFYPLTNPSGFVDSSFVFGQGFLQDAPSDGNQYARKDGAWDIVSVPASYITSVSSPLSVTSGDLSIDLTAYAPLASPALTGNVTITSNSTGAALFIEQAGTGNILTLHDQAADTTFVAIDQNGKINTIPAVAASAGFNVPHGTAPTTPVNGDIWTTTTGLFMRQNGFTKTYANYNDASVFSNPNQTLGSSTAAGTINIGTGATVSGSTRTINIGTASAAGSTNAINIGGGSGTITTTFLGNIGGTFTRTGGKTNFAAPAAGYASVNFAPGNDPTTLATGDVWYDSLTNKLKLRAGFIDPIATENYITGLASNATPLVNGTASAGSSFNFSRNDHVHPTDTTRAPTASPALTGTPTSTTAAADTNTTQIATTAYVVGQAGSATPLVNGTAAVGTSLRYARQDHVHGTDTTRAALESPTFTGVPAAPTAAVDTNTTQLATTAYVVGQGYLKSATASSTYAPLASAALTGVPTAPTATAGTNTTQLATTAFVTAAVPALATTQDSRQFTNDTKAMSPRDVLWSMLSQDFVDISGPSMTVTNTGTITSVQVGQLSRAIRPSNAGACSSRLRTFGPSQVDQTWTASSRPQPASFLNFSLRSIHSGRSTTSGVTDANYTCAVYYGKAEADGVGNLTRRGYGWKMVGGSGSRFLQLQAHNGTTLSSVTSSFAVTAGVAFDWDIESDGAGNVTLYVNGSSVATSTGGPTGSVNITGVAWQEEVVAAAALSSPFMDFVNSRGRYIVINTW
jgi:hypothetical protein